MTTISWFCPRCRCDQSLGANLVAAYNGVDGPRTLVRCPDCTTAVDAPCDVDTFGALVRMAMAQSTERARLRDVLARPDAASVIGGGDR